VKAEIGSPETGSKAEEIAVQRQNAHRGAELHEGLHARAEHGLVRSALAFAPAPHSLNSFLRESGLHLAKQAEIGGGGRGTHTMPRLAPEDFLASSADTAASNSFALAQESSLPSTSGFCERSGS
jgi:hypothetical protein